jgi:hypothetical protein
MRRSSTRQLDANRDLFMNLNLPLRASLGFYHEAARTYHALAWLFLLLSYLLTLLSQLPPHGPSQNLLTLP